MASRPSTARQVRRTLTAMINAGLIEGYLLPRQDVMRAVRWLPPNPDDLKANPVSRAITEDEIPTIRAVHMLAERCAQRSRVWWRELEILLVAYSGMRWGEPPRLPPIASIPSGDGSLSTAKPSSCAPS